MRFNGSSDSCSTHVLLELSEPRAVMRAPVTGAAVSGVILALIAAALICVCPRKRLFIFTAPCGGVRRRLEECEEESDGDSESCGPQTQPDEADQWTLNRDVAAFALKARVVYPISQRYRPLADGASNPSLHEPSKRPAPPSHDSASSLGDDWLSQERGDDESSQFVSCGPSSKTHASHMFRRVQHYPQTPCHSRVSLLCLTLEELQRQTSRLQQEKHTMFLQILRVLLDEREHADIIQEAELTTRGVSVDEGAESGTVRCSVQEAELLTRGVSVDKGAESGTVRCLQETELLTRGVSVDEGAESGVVRCSVQEAELLTRGVSVDEEAGSGTVMCSVEEVDKAGREQLERSLQMAVSFAKQLERLGQNLQRRFSSDVSEEVMRSVVGCLRATEDVLAEVQASVLQMLLDRMECWQEVSDCLREKAALLKQEAELMVKVTGQSVEQLRCDGQLEKQILSDFQTAVNEAVDQSADAVRRQTEALALERVQKGCVRRRRMMKAQSSEWSHVSDSQTDARLMMKAFAELQTRHWHQRRDFELQQDARITDALCERWTSLFSKCRGRLADLCAEFVLRSIAAVSAPSQVSTPSEDHCQSVLKSMKLTVTNQMQREERHAHTHLRRLREQLQRRRQVWLEDEALTRSCLDHFGEQQRAVVKAMVSRHADMQMSCALIEEQQQLLILELQRVLAARCFYLRSVKEMKLTVQSDTQDPCVAVETVPSDEAVIGQNLLHEQLSELEAVADMLQGHAHFLLGHALARAARLQIGGVSAADRQVKERLIDAVCESVHVTRDSVQSLIREYYCGIRSTSLTPHSSAAEDTNTQTEKTDCTRALQTQLNNWARKPTSTELHHSLSCVFRVVELKKACLTEFQKDLNCPMKTHNYRQLRDEEEAFMRRVASLARVSLSCLNKDDFTESLG
ncbi:ellis-van Creveld syndrome protein homolog isoform X2 [Megalobrama amblycephala]|uniref:ellis-van Creveld syndrome protein homolog isoform X2 n=1 Tax=Megalobrama amblycephala TaxID=75352 RepID=UPI0020140081|nr:ellis-van Creveld syndrome protein homolog isoform X2 [Megalobrama amblycephala]